MDAVYNIYNFFFNIHIHTVHRSMKASITAKDYVFYLKRKEYTNFYEFPKFQKFQFYKLN